VGYGPVAVDTARFFLAYQPPVRRKHGIKIQGCKEGVVTDVEANVRTELDDFRHGIVLLELFVERRIDFLGCGGHPFAVAERNLLRVRKPSALLVVLDTFVDDFFGQSLLLRRSRPDVASIGAVDHSRQLDADDLFQLVINSAGAK
jgi:hypothetical protein